MKKAIFIIGPTAVGKTNLAAKISKKIPSVLISADSIQVFKDANIISGKDHPEDTRVELINMVKPSESFSVSDFLIKTKTIIEEAIKNKQIPIIVGGTGFYADALFTEIETIDIPPNNLLRKNLADQSITELQNKLREMNPKKIDSMNESDIRNPRRLIRAIEVSEIGNKKATKPFYSIDEILFIGLKASNDVLRERIKERVKERISLGAINEAKTLFSDYKNLNTQIKTANGYKELFLYLAGELSLKDAVERWITADYHHAKKQMTWFKRNRNIKWFNYEESDIFERVVRLIDQNITSLT